MKRPITALLFIFLAFALTACGGSSASQNSFLGAGVPGLNGGFGGFGGGMATCNGVRGGGFIGAVKLFTMQGQVYPDTQQLRLDMVPPGFEDSNSVLRISAWGVDGRAPTPLLFYIEDRATQTPVSGMIRSVSATDLAAFAEKHYGAPLRARQLLQRVNFVLIQAVSTTFKGLRIAYYQNSAPMAETDLLLPTFDANPNTFAQNNPDFLMNLHPNRQHLGTAGMDFMAATQRFCF